MELIKYFQELPHHQSIFAGENSSSACLIFSSIHTIAQLFLFISLRTTVIPKMIAARGGGREPNLLSAENTKL